MGRAPTGRKERTMETQEVTHNASNWTGKIVTTTLRAEDDEFVVEVPTRDPLLFTMIPRGRVELFEDGPSKFDHFRIDVHHRGEFAFSMRRDVSGRRCDEWECRHIVEREHRDPVALVSIMAHNIY